MRQSLNGRGGEERHRHTSNLNANVQQSPPKVITDVINTDEDGLSGGVIGGAQQQSRNASSNDADLFNGKKLNIQTKMQKANSSGTAMVAATTGHRNMESMGEELEGGSDTAVNLNQRIAATHTNIMN